MSSYVNDYFGISSGGGASASDLVLKITDDDLTIDFTQETSGWFLDGPDGWAMLSADFKDGGVYANSKVADGQILKFTTFDNVVDPLRVGLNFYGVNGLIYELDKLEELLKVRAPRYWADPNHNRPVYLARRLNGETNTSYALISRGTVIPPATISDCTAQNSGVLRPIAVTLNRQPFLLGAPPGQVQGAVELSAKQIWNYGLTWAVESALPAGQVFCLAETPTGEIWAGGANEILLYSGGSWAAVSTSPVALGANVTAVVVLLNGDVLFGESGRIIKRTSAGVWSVEMSSATGAVTALFQVSTGEVYAGDNGNIWKRNTAGTWAVDSTLPDGNIYTFIQSAQSGRIFAGENRRILRTSSPTASTIEVQLAASGDSGEQYSAAGNMFVDGIEGDLDFFNRNYVAMRFSLSIPPGATITSAVLRSIAHRTREGQSETAKIYCQAVDNAPAFTAAANDISSRTLTSAFASWSTSTKWKQNNNYTSSDFAAALQQVVNRAGWSSGNYAAVIVKANTIASGAPYLSTRREAHGFGSNPGKAVVLIVSYTVSPPAGSAWEVASTGPVGDVRAAHQVASIGRIIFGDNGQMLATHDDGQSFEILTTFPSGVVRAFAEASDGMLYAGEAGSPGPIIRSADRGANWVLDNGTIASGDVGAMLAGSDGDIRAGDNGNILKLGRNSQLELGQTATEDNWVFAANHHKTANLTHVLVDDGGVFNSIFPATAFPVTLLPAVPAVNDALYFGINTALSDAAPFGNVVLNIGTTARATTSYTLVWEYWNGSSWASLTVKDGTGSLANVGVNSAAWAMPSNWATTTVNGVTGWWVRVRLSALTGTLTPPTQESRNIYSAISSFVEVDGAETEGTIDSLVKMQVNNRSAGGGPGGSSPPLYLTRLWVGVKPTEGAAEFRAFLNFSDQNNPEGVSLRTSVDAESATSLQTDTGFSSAAGKRVYFNPAAVALNNLTDRVALDLSTTIARDYYGSYLVFLRGRQVGGTAGQVSLRIKVVSGSGGISALTEIQATQTTSDHHLIIFEEPITMPVSALFTQEDIGDSSSIVVQIATASASAGFYLYDLFLLATKYSYVDAGDNANSTLSAIDDQSRLLLDSITVPKALVRALAQKTATDHFKASYYVDSRGPLTLLKAQTHRVWLLAARAESAGSNVWISEPEVCCSLRAWKVDRWLRGRGLA